MNDLMFEAVVAPLCPAGHLPHRWGDWLGAPAHSNIDVWQEARRESISPLEGEMSGRTEGGNPTLPIKRMSA